MSEKYPTITIGIVQISPVFLNKSKTWEKLKSYLFEAKNEGCDLITWGETLLPGYPQHLSPAGGAKFNDPEIKKVYSSYWKESLTLNDPIIKEMCVFAQDNNVSLMGGISEREHGSHYATLLTIGSDGEIKGRHRKIKPTYEERLIWADGDAIGLKTHKIKNITVGGLNCWENWIPQARASLHSQGEMIHVSIWPGSDKLTKDISKFMALEGRSFIIAASGLLQGSDFSHLSKEEFPMRDIMMDKDWQNGGSRIVAPDGTLMTRELIDKEGILTAHVDLENVIEERHNFDYSGHYSRKDIFGEYVNKI